MSRFRASRDPALVEFLAELNEPPWDEANIHYLSARLARSWALHDEEYEWVRLASRNWRVGRAEAKRRIVAQALGLALGETEQWVWVTYPYKTWRMEPLRLDLLGRSNAGADGRYDITHTPSDAAVDAAGELFVAAVLRHARRYLAQEAGRVKRGRKDHQAEAQTLTVPLYNGTDAASEAGQLDVVAPAAPPVRLWAADFCSLMRRVDQVLRWRPDLQKVHRFRTWERLTEWFGGQEVARECFSEAGWPAPPLEPTAAQRHVYPGRIRAEVAKNVALVELLEEHGVTV